MLWRWLAAVLAVTFVAAGVSACGGGSTATVTTTVTSAATTSSSTASTASRAATSTAAAVPQSFSGDGSENLGTITVPESSTLTWSCATCGSGNFIINNDTSDSSQIAVNALDQTSGLTVIDAGTYHDVSINTEGQNWSISITSGNSTQTPSTPAPATHTTTTTPSPAGALVAVNSYWHDVGAGNYAGAYAVLVPGAISLTQAQFVASEQQAGIQSVQFDGQVGYASGSSATVDVSSLVTKSRQNGCQAWTGSYQMTYENSAWMIQRANLVSRLCAG